MRFSALDRSLVATLFGLAFFVVPTLTLLLMERTWAGAALAACGVVSVLLVAIAMTGRFGLAGCVSGAVLWSVYALHALKQREMAQPFLIHDVRYFFDQLGANVTIAGRYGSLLAAVVASACVFGTALALFLKLEQPLVAATAGRARTFRCLALVVAVTLIPVAFTVIDRSQAPALALLKEPHPWLLITSRGDVMSSLILSMMKMDVRVPERSHVDPERTRAMFASPPAPAKAGVTPDIIVWHAESTFDPTMLSACEVDACRFNLYRRDRRTVAGGLLKVNAFGGATWTSEFAVLTGLSHELFGEGGMYSHFTLAPRVSHSLPRLLRKRGYRTVAIYPVHKHFFNAYNAYRYYGFDEFYSAEDFGWPRNGNAPTDEAMRIEMAKILRRDDSRPIFIYVVTQFQHGPHRDPPEKLPEPYRSLNLPGLTRAEQINVSNFLHRLSLTDRAIAALEREFLNDSWRPTVFLHYGDHQPSFDGHMMSLKKKGVEHVPASLHHRLTHFMVKKNYSADDAERYDYGYLDITYIASLILDVAGVPADAYFAASAQLRRLCQGSYGNECLEKEGVASFQDYVFHELRAMR